jgi:hypothetical protein
MVARRPVWLALPSSASHPNPVPLAQAWRPDGVEPNFQSSSAVVSWTPNSLEFAIELSGSDAANRARRLNEPTWELGDVAEVFIAVQGRPDYLEFHVTPENQRLQLHFPADGISRFRAGTATLADFAFDRPGIESSVRRTTESWNVSLTISRELLGVPDLRTGRLFDVSVCRYDYGGKAEPVISSTSLLTAPDFHRRQEWRQLQLARWPK